MSASADTAVSIALPCGAQLVLEREDAERLRRTTVLHDSLVLTLSRDDEEHVAIVFARSSREDACRQIDEQLGPLVPGASSS